MYTRTHAHTHLPRDVHAAANRRQLGGEGRGDGRVAQLHLGGGGGVGGVWGRCKTKGRKKPINTDAEACIPSVSQNISTDKPRINDTTNTNQLGVSNGKSKINKTYMYGLIYPLN